MYTSRALSTALRAGVPRTPIAARIAATRSYAAAAAAPSSASTKPPLALFGIDGTYASALVRTPQIPEKGGRDEVPMQGQAIGGSFTAAAKTNTLDPTAKSLESLGNVFKKDANLVNVLGAPTLTPSDKEQIVAELIKHIGGQDKDGVVKNLLTTLAENNRLGALEGVVNKFAALISAHKGEIELTVTSATPLDNKTLSRLENVIFKSEYVEQGQKLKVVPKVNPEIRGGIIVEIGDRTIDLSVSSKMAKLNKLLKDTL
ncbi:ATP synthase delta subunit-domain-containing protein [Dendryphion nanum]|uniref:ATP synthase subunit 5, mitochondrial n=1 Tax=Dendryphion nanum TaxID=256645 RepID=A0A9P9DNR7_9PLEO|nr:ATP synthase delta subunit-domain-containing protein [Dendryphion nanum]